MAYGPNHPQQDRPPRRSTANGGRVPQRPTPRTRPASARGRVPRADATGGHLRAPAQTHRPAPRTTAAPRPTPRRAPAEQRAAQPRPTAGQTRSASAPRTARLATSRTPAPQRRRAASSRGTRPDQYLARSVPGSPRRGTAARHTPRGARRQDPVTPLVGAGIAALALIALIAVPVAGSLFQPKGGRNLTTTPAADQTVAPLDQPIAQAGSALNELASRARALMLNPPRILDLGTTKTGAGRATFCAVGDNLYNANLLEIADAAAGEPGDGHYAFDGFYSQIAGTISAFDISFINQETTLGGPDRFGYNGYPSYNTPDSLAQTVADVGWDVVNTNSNHTYDTWVESIEHAQGVWGGLEDRLLTVGSYQSDDDRRAARIVTCNGLRIAFLSYSYGQNGYELSDLPNSYYAVPYDEDVMREDVARCRRQADAVVVYLHAGEEYKHEPSETQRIWAQACADAGADLVIGSHVHVIQPMEWLTAADGARVLAVYGLGDFLAGYPNYPATIMSGMFSCTFERVATTRKGEDASDSKAPGALAADGTPIERTVLVTDVVWTPLIEHWQGASSTVRTVKGYTDKQARANELLKSLDDPLSWIKTTTKEVIGKDFTIDM